ncbi:arylesterase [Haliea sp. AH-315-K21]|uniref:Arylesterase n=1 Tax=SAR86 cluster bacterium TaxID=2030880 RepID=A0A2A5CAC6_9GAMM|nr:arylesterase [Haliea sp. AH-315-K21]PCJ40703.1 MAG: arylesterase [SAR86 cluster bacterium]
MLGKTLITLLLIASPLIQAQETFTVLFLGDSLIEGLGLETEQAFTSLVDERLKREGYGDITIVNAGISGSTSASALERMQWYVRSRPDLVILSLGANDGLRGLSVDNMKGNLAEAIEFAQSNNIQVALTGMLTPPNMGPEYTSSFAQVFPDLAAEYQLPFMPFLLLDVAAIPELNQADGIHPNIEGSRIVAEHVYQFLLPLLP